MPSTVVATGYRFKVTQRVFDHLVEAKGVKNMPPPRLKLVDAERSVAWCKGDEIGLEVKAYDLCTTFGPDSLNALAGILAHELTHYYEKHAWAEMFAADFSALPSATEVAKPEDHLQQEIQADHLGGFLAYAAGYRTLGVMPTFLKKVYEAYGFTENMLGYPSLSDRITMATTAMERCQELIHVFEAANYLLALKDYQAAQQYYQYILKDFQSREIYNNLGVTLTLQAITLFQKAEVPFIYPVELDGDSRLSRGNRGTPSQQAPLDKETLLTSAAEHFKTAIILDKDYTLAYLNLANVYVLLQEEIDADYYVKKAMQMAQKEGQNKLLADTQVLLGILAARGGNITEASEYFQRAEVNGSDIAATNSRVMETPTNSQVSSTSNLTTNRPERIGNLSLDQLVIDLQRERLEPDFIIKIDQQAVFAKLTDEQSTILIHLLPFEEKYTFLQLADEMYQGATNLGIELESSQQDILDTYGKWEYEVLLAQGSYLVYLQQQLIFVLNQENEVRQWGIFRRSK